ncbi:MAG: T9SS type A sorting domain-containing protein [Saprospiraceae bacterium]
MPASSPDCTPVSTDSPSTPAAFDIFPNPNNIKEVRVTTNNEKAIEIALYDSTGKCLQQWQNIYSGDSLALHTLPTGTYYVTYIQGNTRMSRTLVVR